MMRSAHDPSRILHPESGSRLNNFGFLRLLFAGLVVVSHSPELVDGDRRREILTTMFGTLSFGELAVDGFFLISGFLITKSFADSPALTPYLRKRVFRIVPAYLVSFWICVLLVAPLAGCQQSAFAAPVLMQQLLRNLMLLQPEVSGCFFGLHSPILNGSMWTIAFEFSCYLLTAALGLAGLYQSRNLRFMGALVFLVVLLYVLGRSDGFVIRGSEVFGDGQTNTRLLAFYLVGAVFYLFGANLKLSGKGVLWSLGLLSAMLFHVEIADLAVMAFGAYILFWAALKAPVVQMGPLADVDISYGLYLYAWPIQNLMIQEHEHINPWVLCLVSLALAGCAGYLSWIFVEKFAIRYAKNLRYRGPKFSRTSA